MRVLVTRAAAYVTTIVLLTLLAGCFPNQDNLKTKLADTNWRINRDYFDTPDNCLKVAVEKQKALGRGAVRCIPMPNPQHPNQQHCYLDVEGYILDNGALKSFILDDH